MAIAGDFDDMSDAGFVRAYDARGARRQVQISTMLVLVLALAAIVLGISTLLPPIAAGRSIAARPSRPHIAETLLDIRG
ncbi:MAG: hypothetical protein ACREDT_05375 [Methylocella sp.]